MLKSLLGRGAQPDKVATDGAPGQAEVLSPLVAAIIALLGIGLWLAFRKVAPVPDVAWLMDGTRQWLGGATLFVDVREINPPLIFYELAALSGGQATNRAFVAGIAIATAISSLWVARHHGGPLGIVTFLAASFAGMAEFGQREHLLLVFVVPYLLARGSAGERALMGVWAFFGVGLKPYFLLVVALPALVEALRDWRSLFDAQKIALGVSCVVYVGAAYLLHPVYFRELIPLAQSVYTYGMALPPVMAAQTLVLLIAVLLADAERRPLAAAVVGAIGSYYIQARYWPYHFIAAAGLGMLLCYWQRRLILLAPLLMVGVIRGTYDRPAQTPIPEGIDRVAVLSIHPSATYPTVTGCGVTSVTRVGSLGWLPGPWNIVTDLSRPPAERARAWALLVDEREKLLKNIADTDTRLIVSDASPRKQYFERPIDYMQFLGPPPGFKLVRRVRHFEIWAKGPISPKTCRERF